MVKTRAVPPKLIKGSGTPVGGIVDVVTAMLTKTWMAIKPVIPLANNEANRSGAFNAILKPLHMSIKNNKTILFMVL